MERLYRVVLLLGVAVYFFGATPALVAKDYCSLKVVVHTPKGQRLEVPVTVYEKSGRKVEKRQTLSEDVQVCDLGIQPVKVVVGLEGCNQIVVKDVALFWEEPYTLKVTYDFEHCMKEKPHPPTPVCEVLFRIAGPDGRWIDKATLKFDASTLTPLLTDGAGRAFLVTKLTDQLVGSVSAAGYATQKFSIGCSDTEAHEEMIALTTKK
jgi:hypothetical protein